MNTDMLLSSSGTTILLDTVVGIYRDRNPADKGKVIKHWIKYDCDNRIEKRLIEGITHPEYAVIKAASHYNQVRNTYVSQNKVVIIDDPR